MGIEVMLLVMTDAGIVFPLWHDSHYLPIPSIMTTCSAPHFKEAVDDFC
jgi:hypothetical protein